MLPHLLPRYRVFALLRGWAEAERWRVAGAFPLIGDLDDRSSLDRLAALADTVIHLAPPPSQGREDTRSRHLLAALRRPGSVTRRFIYISTSGVYGDCGGQRVHEWTTARPESDRGRRRFDAERIWRKGAVESGFRLSILRVPGIYAATRLPLERIRKALPALVAGEDSYTNHIHADDLAGAVMAALVRGRANRTYHASDDSDLKMGDWLDAVADRAALARPPRLSRQDAAAVLSPLQWSFMRESRRLDNRRLKQELGFCLRYPTVFDGLADISEEWLTCSG